MRRQSSSFSAPEVWARYMDPQRASAREVPLLDTRKNPNLDEDNRLMLTRLAEASL